jgi:hypothetical protein
MNSIFSFLASMAGRITRIIAGIALIAWGYLGLSGNIGIVVIVIGLIPLLAGLFDVCVFAPVFKLPFGGTALRKSLK